jgi:hypothetical protein
MYPASVFHHFNRSMRDDNDLRTSDPFLNLAVTISFTDCYGEIQIRGLPKTDQMVLDARLLLERHQHGILTRRKVCSMLSECVQILSALRRIRNSQWLRLQQSRASEHRDATRLLGFANLALEPEELDLIRVN